MSAKPAPVIHGYLTATALADLLGVSRKTIYRAAGKTIPPFHMVCGSRRFREDEIQAWQQAGEVWLDQRANTLRRFKPT